MADPNETVPWFLAEVGQHVYTWEIADGGDFGDYAIETADDPRELYGEERPMIRKRWLLVEITPLNADEPSTSEEADRG